MVVKEITRRCIWCLRQTPNVAFDSRSHVLPECVGNLQQVLPVGIVCDECNNYFGTQVEPALLADPLFHVIAVVLRLQYPRKKKVFRTRIFDAQHPAVGGEHQKLHTDISVSDRKITLDIDYNTKGQLTKTYKPKDLALLSRAVHKIAFETLAWMVFVRGSLDMEVFDSRFDPLRDWVRYGQPHGYVRPVMRLQTFDVKPEWRAELRGSDNLLAMEMNLFGDWYAVSLNSSQDDAFNDLKRWVGSRRPDQHVWCVTETLLSIT